MQRANAANVSLNESMTVVFASPSTALQALRINFRESGSAAIHTIALQVDCRVVALLAKTSLRLKLQIQASRKCSPAQLARLLLSFP